MKRKNDDLLRLAFGELNADAARAVEAQASGDAAASKELEALRDLRASLQHLPSPPPDTLSPERLRAAILDRELRSRRPAPFNWAWAPLALAAFVGAVLFVRPAPRSEPQIVSLPGVHRDEPLAVNFPDFELPLSVDRDTPVAAKPVAEKRAAPRRRSVVRNRVAKVAQPQPAPIHEELEGPQLAMMPPQTIAAPPSTVVDSAPGGEGGNDTVVLVSSKRDLETGAPAATETEASNVLVGG